MPAFWYVSEASAERRRIEADSLPQALLRLRDAGVTVVEAGADPPPQRRRSRIPWRTLIAVYDQLAEMGEQGAPLDRGLRAIAAETGDARLTASLRALAIDIEDGRSLGEAMTMQPGTFPPEVGAAVLAGEEAGDLPGALRSLAGGQRAIARIAGGMAFPLIYPVLVGLVGLGIFGFVATFIFPKFMQLFLDLGLEQSDFPAPTRLAWSLVSRTGVGYLVFGLAALAVFGLWQWMRRTEQGRFNLGLVRLRVPIFGEVSVYTDLARVAAALSVLLGGGVETVRALRLGRGVAQEPAVRLALRRAGLTVAEGGSIVDGLRDTKLLPEEFVFRLGVAERDGTLPEVLRTIADEYVTHADRLARKWVVVSGPVVVIILAVVIGFIGLSMFLPLIGIIQNLSQ